MKNKSGFTLIELLISLGLLAIVLVFMMASLVSLRNEEVTTELDSDMIFHQGFISRQINSDIVNFNKFNMSIGSNPCVNNSCTITYGDGQIRILEISPDNNKIISYRAPNTPADNIIFTRKLPDDFEFASITYSEPVNTALKKIEIKVSGPDASRYNIVIYSL